MSKPFPKLLKSFIKTQNLYLILFIVCASAVMVIGHFHIEKQREVTLEKQYQKTQQSASYLVKTLISEKQHSTLTIGVSLAQTNQFKSFFKKYHPSHETLKQIANRISDQTNFKNTWIQVIDHNGVAIARSWTQRTGDQLAKIRPDIGKFLQDPKSQSSISVGHYDLSFKAMVPIYGKHQQFLGFVEVITHFNSIAEKLKEQGFESVIMVNERYFEQISRPFTQLFVGKNYIANLNASQSILARIKELGKTKLIDKYKNFTLTPDNEFIVINHTLFDDKQKPMADYLIFSPTNGIDIELLEIQEENDYLIIGLIIFLLAVFFLYLSKKSIHFENKTNSVSILNYFLVFLVFGLLIVVVLSLFYQKEKAHLLTVHNLNFKQNYQIIVDKYQQQAQTILKTIVNKKQVIDIMQRASNNEQARDSLRKELYAYLINDYEILKSQHLRQFHFHHSDNVSFLRFHKPNLFGDDLTNIRQTIAYVNRTQKPISGFEEGRVFSGYRNVFPISDLSNQIETRHHLGSVEISYSPYAIAKDFLNIYEIKSHFLIKAEVVDNKVAKEFKNNYRACASSQFYVDQQFQSHIDTTNCGQLDQILASSKILDALNKGLIFSIESQDAESIYTFAPLTNPITKKVVGTYLFEQPNSQLAGLTVKYFIWLAASLVVLILLLSYHYRELTSAGRYKKISERNQQLLDAQKSIVVVTDGKTIVSVNQSFLNFFDFKDLDNFKNSHDCICDCFVKDDRFFHLGKVDFKHQWIERLLNLPKGERIVAMEGKKSLHFFTVTVNKFEHNLFIINFTDITETISNQFSLAKQASHDSLTGAYNREHFKNHIDQIRKHSQMSQRKLAFILFDIDFFKKFNDTYGHNIGDQVLKELTALIQKTIRSEDLFIRWGGEEFLLVVEVENIQNASNIAENLRRKVEHNIFKEGLKVTCSFGVTLLKDDQSYKECIDQADHGLYQSKKLGRNRVSISLAQESSN